MRYTPWLHSSTCIYLFEKKNIKYNTLFNVPQMGMGFLLSLVSLKFLYPISSQGISPCHFWSRPAKSRAKYNSYVCKAALSIVKSNTQIKLNLSALYYTSGHTAKNNIISFQFCSLLYTLPCLNKVNESLIQTVNQINV